MSATITPVNLPCTDPLGQVFECEGKFYRAIFANKQEYGKQLLGSSCFKSMVEKGLFADTRVSSFKIDNYNLVLESETSPFDVPCHYFSAHTLKQAAKTWLSAYMVLMEGGYFLADAHYGNFMLFDGNVPKMIDLGAISRKTPRHDEKPFPGCKAFMENMLLPLMIMAVAPESSRLARLSIRDFPYNGPLFADDDGPTVAAGLVYKQWSSLKNHISTLTDIDALEYLSDYISSLKLTLANKAMPPVSSVSALYQYLVPADENGQIKVMCLGVDSYLSINGLNQNTNYLVVESDRDRLDGLEIEVLSGSVSLQLTNLMNREFLKTAAACENVVAMEPYVKFRHHSQLMYSNISYALSRVTTSKLLLSVAYEDKAQALETLGEHFSEICSIHTSSEKEWFACLK